MTTTVEYMAWYNQAGSLMVRCLSCAALVSGGDTETHTAWHEKVDGQCS